MGATITKSYDVSIEPPQESHKADRPARGQMGLAPQRHSPGEEATNTHYWAKVRRELAQNWPGTGGFSVSAKSHTGGASVADVLRAIAESLRPLSQATGREIALEVCKHTTARALDDDLRAAIRALLESSLAQGSGRVRVVSRPDHETRGRRFILIEALDIALDIPDAVRRKLSKAVIAHSGETSFVSARAESHVRIRLPMAEAIADGECKKISSCEPATGSEQFGFDPRSTWKTSEILEYIPRF